MNTIVKNTQKMAHFEVNEAIKKSFSHVLMSNVKVSRSLNAGISKSCVLECMVATPMLVGPDFAS